MPSRRWILKSLLRNQVHVACFIPEENVCLRGIVQFYFSLFYNFANSVNMLSCLRGDSFSNQGKWTGTHLYSSSRVAGKQSARYFQFGLAQHFLIGSFTVSGQRVVNYSIKIVSILRPLDYVFASPTENVKSSLVPTCLDYSFHKRDTLDKLKRGTQNETRFFSKT